MKLVRPIINNKRCTALSSVAQPTEWKDIDFVKPDYAELLTKFGGGEDRDFSGKAFYLPVDNVDTDQIIPAKYLTETEKETFGKHCLEDAPVSVEDKHRLYKSEILVAKENFGCGSSREHAPWALEGAGIKCVIAPSFARIFENNMFANGLLCITLPKETIDFLLKEKPEELVVDLDRGVVEWDNNEGAHFEIFDYQKELIKDGGSVGVMIKLAAELQKEGKI